MERNNSSAGSSAKFRIKQSKDVLDVLTDMDIAAKKQVKDIEKLKPVETSQVLWVLKKHRYEGW